ncbi:MAG: NAD+ synthase [Anaerolineae bacterium]|nr:NAD+ synthase [Anaerolineae bacterium]
MPDIIKPSPVVTSVVSDRPSAIGERLRIDTDRVRGRIVDFIRQQVAAAGFQRAVIGLSGGVDSATSCFLTVEALGPENVLALRLPYRTSSPDTLADAQAVIDLLGIRSDTVDITPMVEPLFRRFPDMDAVRRGNVMARMRMIVLYDQSAAWRALVVGTGNKTEALLGYTTLYGDAACAFNPVGDLYKTQLRQLAAALGVPQRIIEKPPSADLWPGQTDEGELGFTYAAVDQVLYLLFEERASPDEVVAAGFERAFVERVLERVQRYEFKRRLPPVARISDRQVG